MKNTKRQVALNQLQKAVDHYVDNLRAEGEDKQADKLLEVYVSLLEAAGIPWNP